MAFYWHKHLPMVIALLKINPRPETRKDVLEILRFLRGPLGARQDCLACEIYEAHDSEGEILYLEQWRSMEALSRHIQSSLYMRVLTAMELAARAPEICFHEVADSRGMDLIEALRGGQ